jgi:ribonuclease HII
MIICGLDEAGRGPLAGPLVGAGTILNSQFTIHNLKDSKKLSKLQREKIYKAILESGSLVKTEIISARQINNKGIGWANKEIFRKLIKNIQADKFIVDGNLKLGNLKGKNVKCVINADATRKCVMAASIIAKVTRDRLMNNLHKEYPKYGWNKNMGYGTRDHIEALKEFGVVKYHRDVYVNTVLNKPHPCLPEGRH